MLLVMCSHICYYFLIQVRVVYVLIDYSQGFTHTAKQY